MTAPTHLEINGTITEDDPDHPGQTVRVCYQRVAPGFGNLPGDGTFNRQRRRVVTVTNPRTAKQTAIRQKLTNAVAAWQQLSTSERAHWQTIGARAALPGYNAFIAYHMRNH